MLPYSLEEDEELVERWAAVDEPDAGFVETPGGTVRYLAVPIRAAVRSRPCSSPPSSETSRPARSTRRCGRHLSSVSRALLIGSLLAFLVRASDHQARAGGPGDGADDLRERPQPTHRGERRRRDRAPRRDVQRTARPSRASVRGPASLRRRRRSRTPDADHDHPRPARAAERRSRGAAEGDRARHRRARPDEPDGERPSPAREGPAAGVPASSTSSMWARSRARSTTRPARSAIAAGASSASPRGRSSATGSDSPRR